MLCGSGDFLHFHQAVEVERDGETHTSFVHVSSSMMAEKKSSFSDSNPQKLPLLQNSCGNINLCTGFLLQCHKLIIGE